MKYGIIAFMSVFVLVGLGVMSFGIWSILEGTKANSWPTVPGEVTASEFTVTHEDPNNFSTVPKIAYRYTVAGNDYNGNALVSGALSESFSPAETRRWTNDFPVGARPDVFYDPEDPSTAVLKPGVSFIAWIFVAFGAVFAIVPLVFVFVIVGYLNRAQPDGAVGTSDRWPSSQRVINSGSRFARYFLFVFFGIFLTVGLVLLSFAISMRSNESDSTTWPKTDGKVIYSGIRETTHRDESRVRHSYHPRVVYNFDVDGTTYTSEGITLSDAGSGDRAAAARAVREYPKGKEVPVSYNPEDPYSATLTPGGSTGSIIFMIIGVVFTVVGALGVVVPILYRSLKANTVDGDEMQTFPGQSYDPYESTERSDPFDAPWDDSNQDRDR